MVHMKFGLLAAAVVALSASAVAQVRGPVPLAWRWQQPTSAVPGELVAKNDTIFAAVGRRVYALDRATGNQKWRYPAGDPIQGSFNRGVQISGDVVVAVSDQRILYAIDSESGRLKWEATLPSALSGSPQIAGGLIVLPFGDNTIKALRAEDGSEAWAKPVEITNGIYGSLAAEGNDVFITTGALELICIDAVRGAPRWRVQFAQMNPDVVPVIAEDLVYVISGDFLLGLARQNGGQRVRVNVREQAVFGPAVTGTTLSLVTTDGKVRTFSRQGRELHPPVDLQSVAVTRPVVVGGKIVVNTSNGSMQMIEPADGSILWQYIMRPVVAPAPDAQGRPAPNFMTASGPVQLIGDTLFLTGRDGQVLAFDPKNGVDLTAPFVKMVFPTSGFEMSGRTNVGNGELQPFFLWDVNDLSSGVKTDTIKVEVDGRTLKHQFTRDGQVLVRLDGSNNSGLSDGQKTLTVTASDWLGNTAKATFSITIDNTLPALRSSASSGGSGSGGGVIGGGGGGRDF